MQSTKACVGQGLSADDGMGLEKAPSRLPSGIEGKASAVIRRAQRQLSPIRVSAS